MRTKVNRRVMLVAVASMVIPALTLLATTIVWQPMHHTATHHAPTGNPTLLTITTKPSPAFANPTTAKVPHKPTVVTATQSPEEVSHVIMVKSDSLPTSIMCDTDTATSMHVGSADFINDIGDGSGTGTSVVTTIRNGTSVTLTERDDYSAKSGSNPSGQMDMTIKVNHWGVPVKSADTINVIISFIYIPASTAIPQPDRLVTVTPATLTQGVILPTGGFKDHGFIGDIHICIPKHTS